MFSRRGLFKYLPAFLIPAALRAKEQVIDLSPEVPTGITHEQLRTLAVSIPLPELKILIEKLDDLSTPKRYRREGEPLSIYQYNFPSGKQTWHDTSEFHEIRKKLEEESFTAMEILLKNNKS